MWHHPTCRFRVRLFVLQLHELLLIELGITTVTLARTDVPGSSSAAAAGELCGARNTEVSISDRGPYKLVDPVNITRG